jgi:hypothetical protein
MPTCMIGGHGKIQPTRLLGGAAAAEGRARAVGRGTLRVLRCGLFAPLPSDLRCVSFSLSVPLREVL